jgi:hypothetical protein
MNSFPVAVQMTYLNCCQCGILFALQTSVFNHRDEHDEDIYCPNGHAEQYTTRDREEKTRAEEDKGKQPVTWTLSQQSRRERLGLVSAAQEDRDDVPDEKPDPHTGKPRCPVCKRLYAKWGEAVRGHMRREHGMNRDEADKAINALCAADFHKKSTQQG